MNCYNESHSPTVRKENCFGFDLWVHIFHRYLHVVGLKSYSTNVNYTLFFKHVNNFIFFIHHLIHPESICMALSDIILMRRLIPPESICMALSDIILMRRLLHPESICMALSDIILMRRLIVSYFQLLHYPSLSSLTLQSL